MLTGIIVGQTRRLLDYVQQATVQFRELNIYKELDFSLPTYAIVRQIGSYGPDIVLLEISPDYADQALQIAGELAELQHPIPVIGFVDNEESNQFAIARGMTEVLTVPFDGSTLGETVHRILGKTMSAPGCPLIAFQPAKGGSGASLTAFNVGACLANEIGSKVLLLDLDIYQGTYHMLLNLGFGTSVLEVAEHAHQLREMDWARIPSRVHGVDVLAAGGARTLDALPSWNLDRLLGFVRSRYDYVLVDLPEITGDITETVMSHAKMTYVVTTLEVLYLQMSVCRVRQLEDRRARAGTVQLILNQVPEELTGSLAKESAGVVGRPVAAVLPDQDALVQRVISQKERIPSHTPLGRAYLMLAGSIAGVEIATPAAEPVEAKPRGLLGFLQKARTA
jgi:Flp pilus assembly CpaE family ATPase